MNSKRYDIQGLRAYAIIAVLIFHFFPNILPLGFLGVDVFFVLSGYLISMILEEKPVSAETYTNFYFKRFRRIFPLAIPICAAGIILVEVVQSRFYVEEDVISGLYSMLFSANLRTRTAENEYFYALKRGSNYFTHFWSLSVEVQFYCIAPFLLHLVKRLSNRSLALAHLCAVSLLSHLYFCGNSPAIVFTSTPARLWQFLAGALAHDVEKDLFKQQESSSRVSISGIFYCVAVLLYIILLCIFVEKYEDILPRLAVTVATAVTIANRPENIILSNGLIKRIGDCSYALYLVHWPVVCILKEFEFNEWWMKLLSMTACVLVSVVIYEFYEKWYNALSVCSTFTLIACLYVASSLAVLNCRHCSKLLPWQEADDYRLVWDLDTTKSYDAKEITEINEILSTQNGRIFRMDACQQFWCCLPTTRQAHAIGKGNLSFVIAGNSYSANLLGLVLDNFKEHYGKAATRSLASCELIQYTESNSLCPAIGQAHEMFDADFDREKPDIIFVIQKYSNISAPIVGEITEDGLYQNIMKRIKIIESKATLKIFIMQSLPVQRPTNSEKIHDQVVAIKEDDNPMRKRMIEVAKNCEKCILFDVRNLMRDSNGTVTAKDPRSHLWYFDAVNHFTIVGIKSIAPIFAKMAEQFPTLLTAKYPENVITYP